MTEPQQCELCNRHVEQLTRHHLIPRTLHRSKRAKKRFTKQQMVSSIAWLCLPCHRQIHAVFTEKQLLNYHTLELLSGHHEIAKFLEFIENKPAGFVPKNRQHSSRWDSI